MICFPDTSEISSLEDLNDVYIKSVLELKVSFSMNNRFFFFLTYDFDFIKFYTLLGQIEGDGFRM